MTCATARRRGGTRIRNHIAGTGHFFYRDGLPEQSRQAPDIVFPAGTPQAKHSGGYETLLPAICDSENSFEIHFDPGRPGSTALEIRDARNRLVRSLSAPGEDLADEREQRAVRHRWYALTVWNGRDEKEKEAPAGQYQVLARLSGGQGAYQSLGFVHKATPAPSPHKKRLPPVGSGGGNAAAAFSVGDWVTPIGAGGNAAALRFVNLADGQRLSDDVLVEVTPVSAPGHVLLFLDGEPVAAAEAEITPATASIKGRLRSQVTLPLDTVRYANGPHVLEARDFHGHSTRRNVVFGNDVSGVIYEPDFDISTPDEVTPHSFVTATLPAAQPWEVAVINTVGKTVWTFRGKGRTVLAAWDGMNAQKKRAPFGRYEILLRRIGAKGGATLDTLGYADLYSSGE